MIKILMVEDDVGICTSFEAAIHKDPEFSLVATTGSQSEAMRILSTIQINVMLLDLELEEGDGMHLLEDLKKQMKRIPEIITVTNTCSESILSCVRELGSDFVYKKQNVSYSPENILEIIKMTYPYFKNKVSSDKNRLAAEYSMKREEEYQLSYVESELERMGFLAKKKGTIYLAEAICLGLNVEDVWSIKVTKDIYPNVAQKYNASARGTEKAIRDAIQRTWQQADMATLQYFYPHQWDHEMGRPTNTEFIAHMVDKFKK